MESALFNRLTLPQRAQWKQIYQERNVPFEVRYLLKDWFDKYPWSDLPQSENTSYGDQIYKDLIEELTRTISDEPQDSLAAIHLYEAKEKIQEQFKNRTAKLIEVIQNCLNHERLLIRSLLPDETTAATEEDLELMKYKQKETETMSIIQASRNDNQNLEGLIEDFHNFMQDRASKITNLQETLNALANAVPINGHSTDQITLRSEKCRQEVNRLGSEVTREKKTLLAAMTRGADQLKQALTLCWEMVKTFRLQQEQKNCFLPKPPEGAIDILNRIFEESSRQLISNIQNIEHVLADVCLVQFVERDEEKTSLEDLKARLFGWLQTHVQKAFIIIKQSHNILKIASRRSPTISMSVRILGGLGLGLQNSLPAVEVGIYAESQLMDAINADHPIQSSICNRVQNGKTIMRQCVGSIQANLNNMTLLGVAPLQNRSDDRVPEKKYGIIIYSKVTLCGKEVPLKALSLPIVLVTQTSQEVDAKGTLLWNAAFSSEDRKLYEEEDNIPWSSMEKILRGLFQETGRTLDQPQLDYLAHFVVSKGQAQDFSTYTLKKVRFMRDKLLKKSFTFWTWIYSCKNLILNHISREWKDNVIHGFIGKSEAEKLLEAKPAGTFLVRFRENQLEDSQGANRSAFLGVAVNCLCQETGEKMHHVSDFLKPMDIHRHSLIGVLRGMVYGSTRQPLLRTLHGNIKMEKLVAQYLPEQAQHKGSIEYSRGALLIDVDLSGGSVSWNANQSLIINSSALPHPQFGRSSDPQHLLILPPEISGQSASPRTPSGQSANTLVGPSANASCTLVGPSPTSDSTLAVQCANVSTLPGQTVNLPSSAQPLANPSASRESPAATGFFDDDVVMYNIAEELLNGNVLLPLNELQDEQAVNNDNQMI